MSRVKLRWVIADGVLKPEKLTVSDRFAQALARLKLEYDLQADVWAAAEDVLQTLTALKAMDRWPDQEISCALLN